MVAPAVDGIDLFKIAGRSISGWIPSLKAGTDSPIRQPFCSQLEERLLLYLEYHPQVACYARGDIDPSFAATYRLPTPKDAPFAIGYTFEGKPHEYLPDVVGTLTNGKLFIAEAGMEDDKRQDRNLAKAEAARRLTRIKLGVYWIATERTLTRPRHYNLVFLHARRKSFPVFADITTALQQVWPWGEVASAEEVESRLGHRWPATLVEAAIWKVVADAAANGHLLVDLERFTLDRNLPLALLSPDAVSLVPDSLPDTLLPEPEVLEAKASLELRTVVRGPTFDASTLQSAQREQFHRNLRAVEQVLAGAPQTQVAKDAGIPRSTLSRLVKRTREMGQIACVPYGSYTRKTAMHPAFAECIRRLYLLPTRLSMTAISEHTEMRQVATRLSEETGKPVKLPSYAQVRKEVHRLKSEPELVAMREGAKSVPRERESSQSFVLSIPAPALLTQVDEHTMELYVVTPDGTTVASHVHAAVLVCVKTAAILGAVLSLGPLKEEDYMRLVKQALEPKDRLVLQAGCEQPWLCYGKPAIVFHDRGKIFTSERARQVLVDRLQIITEQAPPYCPSAKGTVESLFRWMTHPIFRKEIFVETAFEKRFQAMLRSAWHKRSWHVIVADPGSGKTMGIRDMVRTTGSPSILAVTAPKNNEDEQAIGNQLFAALGLPLRGRWSERKPKLMGSMVQFGVKCLIVDDAHDLSLEHLMFIKELTDQGCLQYDHPLGLCLVAAGRGDTIPLKETLDQPDTTWLQFRRRLDKLEPFCRIAGHTSEEVREILATLETVYRELFPQLNLRRWGGSIYTWLTQPVLDPTNSGRVTMDYLMKLVTTALEWTYAAVETDVKAETLEKAASLLVLRRDTLRIIDGAGPSLDVPQSESTGQEQASGTEAEQVSSPNAQPEKPTSAPTEQVDQALSAQNGPATRSGVQSDKRQPTKPTKCTFSGVVPIDLSCFLESGIALVECPDCASTRTLEPRGGVLRFKSHDKRKTNTPNTEPRWVKRETDWNVVGR